MSPSPRITEPLSWPVLLSCSRSRCTRSRSPRLPLWMMSSPRTSLKFETLDELKADLEKKLRTRREESAQKDFENAVLTKLIETTEMEIPETMVEYEADRIIEDYENRMQGAGFTFDQYLQMMGTNRAEFRENAKVAALRQIQGDLIFAAVAEAEKLEPTEEEIAAEYQHLADQYDMDVEVVKNAVPRGGDRPSAEGQHGLQAGL